MPFEYCGKLLSTDIAGNKKNSVWKEVRKTESIPGTYKCMPEAECYAKANLPVELWWNSRPAVYLCKWNLGLLLPQDYYNAIENVLIIRINFLIFS